MCASSRLHPWPHGSLCAGTVPGGHVLGVHGRLLFRDHLHRPAGAAPPAGRLGGPGHDPYQRALQPGHDQAVPGVAALPLPLSRVQWRGNHVRRAALVLRRGVRGGPRQAVHEPWPHAGVRVRLMRSRHVLHGRRLLPTVSARLHEQRAWIHHMHGLSRIAIPGPNRTEQLPVMLRLRLLGLRQRDQLHAVRRQRFH